MENYFSSLSRGVWLGLGEGGSAEPGEAKTTTYKKDPNNIESLCLCVCVLGGTPGSAVLWSLVSPRDLAKFPDRFNATLARRRTLGSKGVCVGLYRYSRTNVAKQRGG